MHLLVTKATGQYQTKQSAFTIVELLVVIVVIGILAAIALVSFTGLSNRAIVASLQSDLDGASKLVRLHHAGSSDETYPSGLDCSATPATGTICLKSSPGNSFDYVPDNTTNPRTFVLTVTNINGVSYRATEDTSPTLVVLPVPTLSSPTVVDITPGMALAGANLTSDNGYAVSSRGVCWGTSPEPSANCVAEGSTSTGVFTKTITGFPASTTIYYRGYAISIAGIGYSPDGSFTAGAGLTIQPGPEGKDTYYGTSYAKDGRPDSVTMTHGGWGDTYRDYIEFDIASAPSAASTVSAQIWLWVSRGTNDSGLRMNRITSPWTEAGVNSSSNPTYTLLTSMSALPGGVGVYRWVVTDITNTYKDWKNGTYPNYGVAITPSSTSDTCGNIFSSDNTDVAHRPKLVINQ